MRSNSGIREDKQLQNLSSVLQLLMSDYELLTVTFFLGN